MNTRITLLLLSLSIVFSANAGEFTGKEASKKFPGAEQVVINKISNVPSFVVFKDYLNISEDKALSLLRSGLQMSAEDKWDLYKIQKDDLGFTHKRFYQYHNGVKVETGEYILHMKNGKVKHMNGVFYDQLNIDPNPGISEKAALTSALEHIGANLYKWELEVEEEHAKYLANDPHASHYPEGELVIMAKGAIFDLEKRRISTMLQI